MSQFNEMTTLACASIGGLATWAMGGDFIQGAIMGLKIGLLNHGMHDYLKKRVDPDGLVSWDMPELEVKARKLDSIDAVVLAINFSCNYFAVYDICGGSITKYTDQSNYDTHNLYGKKYAFSEKIWNGTEPFRSSFFSTNAKKIISKFNLIGDFATCFNELRHDYLSSNNSNYFSTIEAFAGVGGNIIGADAGMYLGASYGALLGTWCGGIGAIPGAVIGGVIGAAIGSAVGSATGKELVHYMYR